MPAIYPAGTPDSVVTFSPPTSRVCVGCRYGLHFESGDAAERFISTSNWIAVANGYQCPVCTADLAAGRTIKPWPKWSPAYPAPPAHNVDQWRSEDK